MVASWLVPLALIAAFEGEIASIPTERAERMTGTSWHAGCPVPLSDLRILRVAHRGFDGEPRVGELIVHREVATDVLAAFRELYEAGYPIERMQPVSDFGGDDDRSMAANNTSAFNCRPITGRSRGFSAHSYGTAIDLNPLYNPYVRGDQVAPPAGRRWADRTRAHPARLDPQGSAVQAFTRRGFRWGGSWKRLKDYQHFVRRLPERLR